MAAECVIKETPFFSKEYCRRRVYHPPIFHSTNRYILCEWVFFFFFCYRYFYLFVKKARFIFRQLETCVICPGGRIKCKKFDESSENAIFVAVWRYFIRCRGAITLSPSGHTSQKIIFELFVGVGASR